MKAKVKVIVVEPEQDVRGLIKDSIEQATGKECEAIGVTRFSDAQEVVEQHPDAQAVFVTLGTPTERGGEVAQGIKRLHPSMKVVLTSPADADHLAPELGLDGFLSNWHFGIKEKVLEFVA